MVTVIWDTWLRPGTEEEGLRLTRQVWSDMRSFDGYVSHQIFIDQDVSGTHRRSRQVAKPRGCGRCPEKCKDSERIRQLTPLLARPRVAR